MEAFRFTLLAIILHLQSKCKWLAKMMSHKSMMHVQNHVLNTAFDRREMALRRVMALSEHILHAALSFIVFLLNQFDHSFLNIPCICILHVFTVIQF